jgi:hypothetical protein
MATKENRGEVGASAAEVTLQNEPKIYSAIGPEKQSKPWNDPQWRARVASARGALPAPGTAAAEPIAEEPGMPAIMEPVPAASIPTAPPTPAVNGAVIKAGTNAVREQACDYLQRKWQPIKLGPRSKEPADITKPQDASAITWGNVDKLTPGDNIGVRFTKSGPLKDLDLDYQAAADLAKEVGLVDATVGFGRKTVGTGHLLYNEPGCDAKKFELPKSDTYPKPLPLHKGEPSLLVLEVRGANNTYTMFPPSVHPETGETLEWNGNRREPLDVPPSTLHTLAGRHAVAAAVLYFYPKNASARYEVRMALSGVLIKSGIKDDLAKIYVQAVAHLAGDKKWKEDFVKNTGRRLKDGKKTSGLPKLVEALQLPKTCERVFREWLLLDGGPVQDDENTIVIREGALSQILNRAEAALMSAGIPIYQRGGELVMTLKVGNMVMHDIKRGPGATVLHSVDASWLVRKLSDVIKWVRVKKVNKKLVSYPADPPTKYAATLITSRDVWKFPQLRGVILAPTLSQKGDIIETPGYHAGSGLLLDFKAGEFPPIPPNPTKDDALAALEKLERPLRKFPFVGEDKENKNSASRSVALSAQLTALIRASLRTVPLHGFDAPVAGTGKSLLAESPGYLTNGMKPAAMTQSRNPEEDEKRLSTVLHAGDNIIMIDNCQHQITGDFLCSMLTQELVQARILGLSERRLLPCTALVVATGNNLTFAGDVTRRAVKCSLDAQIERPDTREFDFDFTKEILDSRPELVIAGLTILRAYAIAGRPQPEKKLTPMGSFEDWSWVRGALVWLGRADPADTREAILEADPRKAELADMLAAWELAYGTVPKTLAEIGRDPDNGPASEAIVALRVLFGEVSGKVSGKPVWNARSAGWWMRRNSKRIVGGRCFVQDGRPPRSFWKIHHTDQTPKDENETKKLPWEGQ